jgi:hypothetical protein
VHGLENAKTAAQTAAADVLDVVTAKSRPSDPTTQVRATKHVPTSGAGCAAKLAATGDAATSHGAHTITCDTGKTAALQILVDMFTRVTRVCIIRAATHAVHGESALLRQLLAHQQLHASQSLRRRRSEQGLILAFKHVSSHGSMVLAQQHHTSQYAGQKQTLNSCERRLQRHLSVSTRKIAHCS